MAYMLVDFRESRRWVDIVQPPEHKGLCGLRQPRIESEIFVDIVSTCVYGVVTSLFLLDTVVDQNSLSPFRLDR